MRTLLLAATLSFFTAAVSEANPVPGEVAEEFRELVATTAKDRRCRDVEALAGYFASYGLDLLRASDVKTIEKRFDVFAPILVEAQRPGRQPNFAIHRLYRAHADSRQKAQMLSALREWLTVSATESSVQRRMGTDGPESMMSDRMLLGKRLMAVEMLADWGDKDAIPLIEHLAESDSLSERAAWRLARDKQRLIDPTAGTLLNVDSHGMLWVAPQPPPVRKAAIRRGNWENEEDTYVLSESEISGLWPLLAASRIGKDTNWVGDRYAIVVELENGVRASFSPTERGSVVYMDNASLDFRQRITLQSYSLWNWIWSVFERQLGETRH